jgi:hypothetical protein
MLQVSAEVCHSLHVNTGPGDRYHDRKVWNTETMRQILSTLGIWPHGREPVVTGLSRAPIEPKCTEEEVIALLEAE